MMREEKVLRRLLLVGIVFLATENLYPESGNNTEGEEDSGQLELASFTGFGASYPFKMDDRNNCSPIISSEKKSEFEYSERVLLAFEYLFLTVPYYDKYDLLKAGQASATQFSEDRISSRLALKEELARIEKEFEEGAGLDSLGVGHYNVMIQKNQAIASQYDTRFAAYTKTVSSIEDSIKKVEDFKWSEEWRGKENLCGESDTNGQGVLFGKEHEYCYTKAWLGSDGCYPDPVFPGNAGIEVGDNTHTRLPAESELKPNVETGFQLYAYKKINLEDGDEEEKTKQLEYLTELVVDSMLLYGKGEESGGKCQNSTAAPKKVEYFKKITTAFEEVLAYYKSGSKLLKQSVIPCLEERRNLLEQQEEVPEVPDHVAGPPKKPTKPGGGRGVNPGGSSGGSSRGVARTQGTGGGGGPQEENADSGQSGAADSDSGERVGVNNSTFQQQKGSNISDLSGVNGDSSDAGTGVSSSGGQGAFKARKKTFAKRNKNNNELPERGNFTDDDLPSRASSFRRGGGGGPLGSASGGLGLGALNGGLGDSPRDEKAQFTVPFPRPFSANPSISGQNGGDPGNIETAPRRVSENSKLADSIKKAARSPAGQLSRGDSIWRQLSKAYIRNALPVLLIKGRGDENFLQKFSDLGAPTEGNGNKQLQQKNSQSSGKPN